MFCIVSLHQNVYVVHESFCLVRIWVELYSTVNMHDETDFDGDPTWYMHAIWPCFFKIELKQCSATILSLLEQCEIMIELGSANLWCKMQGARCMWIRCQIGSPTCWSANKLPYTTWLLSCTGTWVWFQMTNPSDYTQRTVHACSLCIIRHALTCMSD